MPSKRLKTKDLSVGRTGSQRIAPLVPITKGPKPTVKKGGDLRSK